MNSYVQAETVLALGGLLVAGNSKSIKIGLNKIAGKFQSGHTGAGAHTPASYPSGATTSHVDADGQIAHHKTDNLATKIDTHDLTFNKFTPEVKQDLVNALQKGDTNTATIILKEKLGWHVDKAILDKIPDNVKFFDIANSDTKLGIRFQDPTGSRYSIRIMQGNPNAEWPSQRVDYAKITSNGKVMLRDGSLITNKDFARPVFHPDAHIPLDELRNWKEIFEK